MKTLEKLLLGSFVGGGTVCHWFGLKLYLLEPWDEIVDYFPCGFQCGLIIQAIYFNKPEKYM